MLRNYLVVYVKTDSLKLDAIIPLKAGDTALILSWTNTKCVAITFPELFYFKRTCMLIGYWEGLLLRYSAWAAMHWTQRCWKDFCSFQYRPHIYEGVSEKFSDWPPGARTASGRALCHWTQFCRYFVRQCSEFCSHNPLCCFWTSNTKGKRIFRYRLSPKTFGYTLAFFNNFKQNLMLTHFCDET
jgi:hypothetical protein